MVLILKPLSLYSVFGSDTSDMLDKTMYMDDWVGGLSDKLKNLHTPAEILSAVYSELFITNPQSRVHSHALHVIQALQSDTNPANITHICDEMGMTERSLERKTKLVTGLSPKTFKNIARFQHTYHDLSAESLPLTRLAHRYHFSDHSHFTREFKKYAGFLPSKIDRFKNGVI